jgi:hypothetical protein
MALVALAAIGGHTFASRGAVEPAPALAATIANRSPAAPAIEREVLVAAIRAEVCASVRAELAAQPAAHVDEPLADAHDAAPEPGPEAIEAEERGRAVVASAIARGRLTEEDGKALGAATLAMTAEQRDETLRALSRAINADQVVLDGPLMLF